MEPGRITFPFFFSKVFYKKKNREWYPVLRKILGFYPRNLLLYELAFRHKSASIRGRDGVLLNNERLEFLGDAVLNVLVTDLLFNHFESEGEGFLTNTRSKIVQRETLNNIALELGLDKWVLKAEYALSPRQSIFGNTLEALIGAVYLDRGYRGCKRFLKKKIIQRFIDLEHVANQEINFKSKIIEWCQHQKVKLSFEHIELPAEEESPLNFEARLFLNGIYVACGKGCTKKQAQQKAARDAMTIVESRQALYADIMAAGV
ncbi:MAG TPA: ribonuclease III [Bacteroidales bacterium]|nr:ribonuclease III [Bacteroidales bacterium]